MPKYKIVQTGRAEKRFIKFKKYISDNYGIYILNKILSIIEKNILNLSLYPLMYPNYREKKTYHKMPLYNGAFEVIYQVIEDKKIVSIYGIYHHTQEINPDILKEIRLFI